VLATEHFLDLAGLHFLIERLERLAELGINGLARVGPLNQHGKIVALFLERQAQIAILLDATAPLQDFLGFSLVFPEVGGGGARLQAGQLLVESSGFKDSSADRSRACSNPRNVVSTRQR
jgi:hypothetical protein